MASLVRTGISIDRDVLQKFDRAIARKGYSNRSEAIRDLVREHLVTVDVTQNRVIVGSLTLVYDPHRPNLSQRLIEAQHRFGGKVLATTHVHLDSRHCLEVIIVKGRSAEVQRLADQLLSLRGVKHGKLVMTTSGKHL
jgi:CopG family nickel-responsive transcriptional regulator